MVLSFESSLVQFRVISCEFVDRLCAKKTRSTKPHEITRSWWICKRWLLWERTGCGAVCGAGYCASRSLIFPERRLGLILISLLNAEGKNFSPSTLLFIVALIVGVAGSRNFLGRVVQLPEGP